MRTYIYEGEDNVGSIKVDQSDFFYLDQLAARAWQNPRAAFEQMEWE